MVYQSKYNIQIIVSLICLYLNFNNNSLFAQEGYQIVNGYNVELNRIIVLDNDSILIAGSAISQNDSLSKLIIIIDSTANIHRAYNHYDEEARSISSLSEFNNKFIGIEYKSECTQRAFNNLVVIDTSNWVNRKQIPLDYFFKPLTKPLLDLQYLGGINYMCYQKSFVFFFNLENKAKSTGGKYFSSQIINIAGIDSNTALVATKNNIYKLSNTATELNQSTFSDSIIAMKKLNWTKNQFVVCFKNSISIIDENLKSYFNFNKDQIQLHINTIIDVKSENEKLYVLGKNEHDSMFILQYNRLYNIEKVYPISSKLKVFNDWQMFNSKFYGLVKNEYDYCNIGKVTTNRHDYLFVYKETSEKQKPIDISIQKVTIDSTYQEVDSMFKKNYNFGIKSTLIIENQGEDQVSSFSINVSGTFNNYSSICFPQHLSLKINRRINPGNRISVSLPFFVNHTVDTLLDSINLQFDVFANNLVYDNNYTNNKLCIVVNSKDTGIGISEKKILSNISIFPTVCSSGTIIYLKSQTEQHLNKTIQVYNSSGKLISQNNFKQQIQLNTVGLSVGLYLIKVQEKDRIFWQKFVIN